MAASGPWAAVVLVALAGSCGGSDPYAGLRNTRVGREQRVITGNPSLDDYFGSVWEIQRALGSADLRRADALASLSIALGLTHDAALDRLAGSLRRHMTDHGITTVDVTVVRTPRTLAALEAWTRAVTRSPDGSADTQFVHLEGSLEVTVTFHGREPGTMAPAGEAAAKLLRRCDALQAVMDVLPDVGDALVQQGQALAAGSPRWRSELLAASRFCEGVGARSNAQANESRRMTQWIRASLTPDE